MLIKITWHSSSQCVCHKSFWDLASQTLSWRSALWCQPDKKQSKITTTPLFPGKKLLDFSDNFIMFNIASSILPVSTIAVGKHIVTFRTNFKKLILCEKRPLHRHILKAAFNNFFFHKFVSILFGYCWAINKRKNRKYPSNSVCAE